MRYRIICAIDAFDAHILQHRLYRAGLCDWIGMHPWWGTTGEAISQEILDSLHEGFMAIHRRYSLGCLVILAALASLFVLLKR